MPEPAPRQRPARSFEHVGHVDRPPGGGRARESALARRSRPLRRRLSLLAISLIVCCQASLAFADGADSTHRFVPPPSPLASCLSRARPCGPVKSRAAFKRAAARIKLPVGALRNAARQGMRELLGFGDPRNPLRWDPNSGLWGGYAMYHTSDANPDWWQSAIATWVLVRYLEATGSTDPAYQEVLDRTFELNVSKPGSRAPLNFANEYMDDTGWWGLAWTEAARYELNVRGDSTLADRYLAVAEWDANYIASAPRSCGGIVWQLGYPPDTISNAEFAALSAELYAIRHVRGPFHDGREAASWLRQARWALFYLRSRRLVNPRAGTVRDGLTRRCLPQAGPFTYTEGEVADAFIQMGAALHNNSYFAQARKFLDYTMGPSSGMSRDLVLQEYCEPLPSMCHSTRQFDMSSFKGIFVQAVVDYDLATGTHVYRPWLQAQAGAILAHAVSDRKRPARCTTPHRCQFGFYWSRDVAPPSAPVPVSLASHTSALQALVAALAG